MPVSRTVAIGMMERIGKYEIVREIGSGAFGSVYLANDERMGRQVAIKVLKAPQDHSLLARFRAEARAAGNLYHRNIVTVHELGE
jgi:eukaryotic-like serine/threonine-protein kinase